MEYVAYAIVVFTAIQFLVVCINCIWRQIVPNTMERHPLVSILIPARNEEKNIARILSSILQHETGAIEVLVYDDNSSDATASIIQKFQVLDSRVRYISPEELPQGWKGKNFACYTLSQHARGSYLLFLDADVYIEKPILADYVAYCQRYNLGMLSVFPTQTMITRGEQMCVPLMNYILQSLLPLIFVRTSGFVSFSAANGQCMLFDAATYKHMQPHDYVKAATVEDIAIARYLKAKRVPIACIADNNAVFCRMYENFQQSVYGFVKYLRQFFGGSYAVMILFWIFTFFGIFIIATNLHYYWLLMYVFATFSIRFGISYMSNQNTLKNIVYHYAQLFCMGMIIYYILTYSKLKQYTWKERNV